MWCRGTKDSRRNRPDSARMDATTCQYCLFGKLYCQTVAKVYTRLNKGFPFRVDAVFAPSECSSVRRAVPFAQLNATYGPFLS